MIQFIAKKMNVEYYTEHDKDQYGTITDVFCFVKDKDTFMIKAKEVILEVIEKIKKEEEN